MEIRKTSTASSSSSSIIIIDVVVGVVLLIVAGGLMQMRVVRADMYSAVVDLERLLEAEKKVAGDLRQYVAAEYERLERLTSLAEDMDRHSTNALEEPDKHVGNPINAFLLIKRFTADWEQVVNTYMRSDFTSEFLSRLPSRTGSFPTNDDLHGAAEALLRLQDTYALSTRQMASGNLMGVYDSPSMTANDCMQLAVIAYSNQDYYHTVMWGTEALSVYETEVEKTINRSVILDYLSYALYMQGNVRHALKMTEEWLQLEPDHERAENNRKYYIQLINEEQSHLQSNHQSPTDIDYSPHGDPINKRPLDTYTASEEFQNYERLCRGERTHILPFESQLTCQYLRHHPMFYISPVKAELLHINPNISIFHQIATEKELKKVRQLARPRLARSVVYHSGPAGTFTPQKYRISKSAWLSDTEDPLIARISQKASAVAQLTLDSAELLQVLNYGIGGHYETHYDFAVTTELGQMENYDGNRIATFICYASNVTAGGATVFPDLGIQLWPQLGSCGLWYNLHRSGAGDFSTRHAACPVLSGYKWACNKWFHERGQERIRPCSLSSNE